MSFESPGMSLLVARRSAIVGCCLMKGTLSIDKSERMLLSHERCVAAYTIGCKINVLYAKIKFLVCWFDLGFGHFCCLEYTHALVLSQ